MTQLIRRTSAARRVSYIDMSFNSIMIAIGTILLAVGVTTFVLSFFQNGWVIHMAAIYAALGVTACVGCGLTLLSTLRIIQACRAKRSLDAL